MSFIQCGLSSNRPKHQASANTEYIFHQNLGASVMVIDASAPRDAMASVVT